MADRILKAGDLDPRTLRWCAKRVAGLLHSLRVYTYTSQATWLAVRDLQFDLEEHARTESARRRKRRARRG
jgi:hypothetical protein